jgi:hypothetical protein
LGLLIDEGIREVNSGSPALAGAAQPVNAAHAVPIFVDRARATIAEKHGPSPEVY